MLHPRIPANPTPTGETIPLITTATAVDQHPHAHVPAPHAAALCSCQHPAPPPAVPVPSRTGVQLTPGALITVVIGGTATVLVVGAVLVSLLLAVAVTGVSLTICALVIRSLLTTEPPAPKRR
ncbi:SpdD-like protein [Streptomyces apocyni]|uniref:SpdD-like protein n=1 Tax=Streptomyces apocyni TaxID=2654677 RepID=UPI0012EAFB9A|nr:SpdD-like protein [Streptomyces apocyni]